MINNLFKDFFDKWMSESPDGRPFVRAPWEPEYSWDGEPIRSSLPAYIPPIGKTLLFLIVITSISLIAKAALLAGVGAALISLCFLAYKESWNQSGAITLSTLETLVTISEHQPFKISLRVTNKHAYLTNPSFLILRFGSIKQQSHIISIDPLGPLATRNISVYFDATTGMGTYSIESVLLITQDHFGLISRCVEHKLDLTVEVLPEYTEIRPIELLVAGLTSHSGSIESNSCGDSVNFLGSRFFRNGDSIRRIDWKKTERVGNLIVREFEKFNSTDATIILDTRSLGVFQYKNLDTFELMKDSVIALSRSLISQRLRVRLITESLVSDFGKGQTFLDYLTEIVKEIRPESHSSYEETLNKYREIIPAYSVVIPFFFSVNLTPDSLLESVYLWSLQHIQIQPIIVDIERFDKEFLETSRLNPSERSYLNNLRGMYLNNYKNSSYSSSAQRISEKSIIIGPGESLGQAIIRQQL